MIDFDLTIGGQHTTLPFSPPAQAARFIATVSVGPFPDDISAVAAVIQRHDPGRGWTDAGGLSASGSTGDTASGTSVLECPIGTRFRARIAVRNGPVPVPISTEVA